MKKEVFDKKLKWKKKKKNSLSFLLNMFFKMNLYACSNWSIAANKKLETIFFSYNFFKLLGKSLVVLSHMTQCCQKQ